MLLFRLYPVSSRGALYLVVELGKIHLPKRISVNIVSVRRPPRRCIFEQTREIFVEEPDGALIGIV